MGITLSDDEAWERLAKAHTGIFTTLRRDGRPVSLPIWFAVLDKAIYAQTPSASAKVKRVRNDPRASFLVESGISWVELTAVLVHGDARVVDDEEERRRATKVILEKYDGYGVPTSKAPKASLEHYGKGMTVIRLDPVGSPVTWDNSKLRLRDANAADNDPAEGRRAEEK